VLCLSRLAESRGDEPVFAPSEIDALFDRIGLPRPSRVSNDLTALQRAGLVTRLKGRTGAWRLTPMGTARTVELVSDMDLAALVAEMAGPTTASLGEIAHPLIPPSLAPPELLGPLRGFLAEFPFERNVFGMTRFPDRDEDADPIAPALEAAREACRRSGLIFHLASDRQIVDDLWPNVAAHMWGCRYGIAFLEARSARGLNYNLTIEIGACLTLGRRIALLKDQQLEKLPTDLVGRIYKEVDLDAPATVTTAVGTWIHDDLRFE
jgi:hypothetical protein